jgi:hypothetical protein
VDVRSLAVDQISIRAPGLSPEEGRRLARLLADGLPGAVPPGAGAAAIDSVSVHHGSSGAPVDELARRLLEQLAAELRRHL